MNRAESNPSPQPVSLGDRGVRACADGRLVVVFAPASDAFPELEELIEERYAQLGQAVALVVLIPPHAERPGPKLKHEVDALLKRCDSCLVCFTMVVLGQGFLASTFISLASGVLLFARLVGVPKSVHADVDKAAAWVEGKLQDPTHSQAVIREAMAWAIA